MKLWLKQTLICLLVILLTFGACVTFFVMQQTGQLLDDADTAARQSVQVFCEHLSTLDRTAAVSGAADDTTVRALIQYTFSSYAHLLQSATCAYSLAMDGAYLYNISAYDPMALLPAGTEVITATRLLYAADEPVIVCVNNTTVLGQPVSVYLVQDVSAVYAQIGTLVRNAQLHAAQRRAAAPDPAADAAPIAPSQPCQRGDLRRTLCPALPHRYPG